MSFKRKEYPEDWEKIRVRILERDEHLCKQCKVPQYSVGVRFDDGTFLLSEEAGCYEEAKKFVKELKIVFRIDPIVIVLAVGHVGNHDPRDCREENLAMLCQYHHLRLDRYRHSKNARATWLRKRQRGQGELFGAA